MAILKTVFDFILPKKKQKAGGSSYTDTFKPSSDEYLSLPEYKEHLDDIQSTRLSDDSQALLKTLFRTDPDTSAAVNAYLSLSDTEPTILVYDMNGLLSREGIKLCRWTLYSLFSIYDYTLGYQRKLSLREFKEQMGYMLLLRGSMGAELVFDKAMRPSSVRIVDMQTIKYKETASGEFKPYQKTNNTEDDIDLDIPTFFTSTFRQDPTTPYSYSFFTSAINTVAARANVINDLYRIMNYCGYPRIHVKVFEEVLKKNAPLAIRDNVPSLNDWVKREIDLISSKMTTLRPNSPIVHTDSMETSMLNEKNPGASLQVSEIINTLNSQNQAGLKVVATVLGRGQAGVNTASTETIVFSKHADSFNRPFEDLLSRMLTLAIRMQGFDGFVVVKYKDVELRPKTELENQMTMKQVRYQEMLSYGEITDDEYDLEILGRLRDEGLPALSGTRFLEGTGTSDVDTYDPKANDSPLNRELSDENDTAAKSNSVQPD